MTKDNTGIEQPFDEFAIHRFIDGTSDGESRRRIMAAMAVDEELEAKVNSYRKINNSLMLIKRSLKPRESRSHDELIDAISNEMDKRSGLRRSGLQIAAAIAIAVSVGTAWFTALEPEKRAAIRESISFVAVSETKMIESRPRYNFGTDMIVSDFPSQAIDGELSFGWWESNRIAESLKLPNLESLGMRLMAGGVIKASDQPAVRLFYVDGSDHGINLYVGLSENGRDDAFTVLPEGQMSLHWRHGKLVFALLGSADNQNFLDVVELISQSVIEAQSVKAVDETTVPVGEPSSVLQKALLPQKAVDQPLPETGVSSENPVNDVIIDENAIAPAPANAPEPL